MLSIPLLMLLMSPTYIPQEPYCITLYKDDVANLSYILADQSITSEALKKQISKIEYIPSNETYKLYFAFDKHDDKVKID
jgi:hypothetical protein